MEALVIIAPKLKVIKIIQTNTNTSTENKCKGINKLLSYNKLIMVNNFGHYRDCYRQNDTVMFMINLWQWKLEV